MIQQVRHININNHGRYHFRAARQTFSAMLTFNKNYGTIALVILVAEVLIALFVSDGFIRPYVGDVLVVVLIYCFIKSFLRAPVLPTALSVLGLAFTTEFLQYVGIVEMLEWQHSNIARIVIGTSFEWADLLAYIMGIVFVLAAENIGRRKYMAASRMQSSEKKNCN
ncbi:MAG TPA: DUF2809 domain-containing protein [Ohtaekwangia sp.]|nr:DUF2809 domain-containing protein [Ohtaekwangia sp.]